MGAEQPRRRSKIRGLTILVSAWSLLVSAKAGAQFPFSHSGRAPSLNLDFTAMSALPTGLTFTRSTTAYRTNASGQLELMAIDTPRFEYDPVTLRPRGLLMEPQGANQIKRSQEINDNAAGYWVTRTNVTVTADAGVAPDGTTTADLVTETTGTGLHKVIETITYNTTTMHTASVYAKLNAGTRFANFGIFDSTSADSLEINCNLTTGEWEMDISGSATFETGGCQPVGNGWYRLFLTGNLSLTGTKMALGLTPDLSGNTSTGSTSNSILFWGAQLENNHVPSSYIPTTTTAVTRTQDNLKFANLNWFNPAQGTLYAEYENRDGLDAAQYPVFMVTKNDLPGTWPDDGIYISDSDFYDGSGVRVAGGNSFVPADEIYGDFRTNRVALAYKANDFAWIANNMHLSVDAAGSLPAPTTGYIASAPTGASTRTRWVKKIRYWKERLSNAKLRAMTNHEDGIQLDYIAGFELSNIPEEMQALGANFATQNTVVRSGAKAAEATLPAATTTRAWDTIADNEKFGRIAVNFDVTSNPTANSWASLISLGNSSGTSLCGGVAVNVSTTGALSLQLWRKGTGSGLVGPAYPINENQWYVIEFRCFRNATSGELEFKVNGTLTGSWVGDTGGTNPTSYLFNQSDKSFTTGGLKIYFDDFAASYGWPGQGKVISRGPASGTPSYNQWTKSSGTSAAALLNDEPFNSSTYIVSAGANHRQNVNVASFYAAQAGRGSDYMKTTDRFNLCFAYGMGKKAGTGAQTYEMNLIWPGGNVSTDQAPGTTDSWLVSNAWYPPIGSGANMELGFAKWGAAGNEFTVYDVMLNCDFTSP